MEEEAVQPFQKEERVQVLPNKDLVKCQIESYRHILTLKRDDLIGRYNILMIPPEQLCNLKSFKHGKI